MEDTKHGGARDGAGRKSKADEEKVSIIFTNALKELYSVDTDDEAKSKFVKESLLKSQRGQLFIAEHLFGKPKETVDTKVTFNNFSIKDVLTFKKNDKTE
jgi:hypothetical protein